MYSMQLSLLDVLLNAVQPAPPQRLYLNGRITPYSIPTQELEYPSKTYQDKE